MRFASLTYKSFLNVRSGIAFLLLAMALMYTQLSMASTPPLPADQAFIFSLDKSQSKEILASWQIAPGYYIYRDRLNIKVTPASQVENIAYPQGEFKYDTIRGRMEVFTGLLTVHIQLKEPISSGQIMVEYQGCSSFGFCYPPEQQTINLGAAPITNQTAMQSVLTDQNAVQSLFGNHNLIVTLLIFAGIGLLLAFTPCVLPMIPILTGIIIGQRGKISTKKAFLLSGTYVLGSSITYALAGLAAALMGNSLQASLQMPWVIAAVSMIFVLLAFSLFGLYHLRLPHFVQRHITHVSHKQQGGTFVGVFFMGVISTLIVSPCVTAPLVGVLIYIGQTGDKFLGASALFAMGLGMGIPLLLIGVSAGRWLPKTGSWMIAIKEMFGMLLLGMAIWLLSRILPALLTKLLWIALIAGALTYIILGITRSKRLHRKWAYTLGVAAGLISLVLIASNPSNTFSLIGIANPTLANNFILIHNVNDLNNQLTLAREEHKPVLVDFYADWCDSCLLMDKQVFDKPKVQEALKNYIMLRADLTANNSDDQELLKKYAVVAPPTVLLFDKMGQENNLQRIVGEVNGKEFLSRLNTFELASCSINKINC